MEKIEIKSKSRTEKGGEHHKQKPNLRKIRLELPESSILLKRKQTQFNDKIPVKKPMADEKDKTITIYPPSLQYKLDSNPTFVFEVILPSSTFQFTATPNPEFVNPHFFIYTSTGKGGLPINVQISVNNNSCRHITADENPIDFTDALSPFGKESVLSIETDAFVVPFNVIAIWADERPLTELLDKCAKRNPLSAISQMDICPITKTNVTIAGKGKECMHDATFDAPAFLGRAMGTGDWSCPICKKNILLEDLCVDLSSIQLTDIMDTSLDPPDWNQRHSFDDLFTKSLQ